MKKYLIILFALLISAVVFAENAETDVSMAKITLNTGGVFIGEIIVENEQIVMIRTAEGNRFQFPINDIESIEKDYTVGQIIVVEQRVSPPREEAQRPVVVERPSMIEIETSSDALQTEEGLRRNELIINSMALVINTSFEFSYERILERHLSIGFDGILQFNRRGMVAVGVLPYLRGFFSDRNYATGFFGEVHGSVDVFTITHSPPPIFGFGTGIGYKYVSNNNWVIELTCRIAKAINHDTINLLFRLSVGIGRRF